MRIKVKAFARFREILGKEIDLELKDGSRVRDLLAIISAKNDLFRKEAFDELGELKDHVLLMKNMRKIESRGFSDMELKDGDEIAVFPPVAGG